MSETTRQYCGARRKHAENGETCRQAAGWGTNHPGTGRCKLHGGCAGRPIETGRYSYQHRASLEEKARRFLEDSAPGDLTEELALSRAMLQVYLEKFPDGTEIGMHEIGNVLNIVETIGRLVERISRMLNQTALTQAEVGYLQARLADIILTYVKDDDERDRCVGEIAAAFGLRSSSPAAGGYLTVETG